MKEIKIIETIKNTLNSKYINDDCAYLKDFGIVITQDSLVEGVHFLRKYITPFMLGYKACAVNLSDIYASGAQAKYLTCSLSLPKDVDEAFVEEFYKGAKSVNKNVEIVGGDITGSDKIFVSICAIGSTKGRKISSRSNAKVGYKIVTNGVHGSSACGLELLLKNQLIYKNLIQAHLMPNVDDNLSTEIARNIKEDYAMMDSSDGLMDVLYKIAELSNVCALVDFDKIPIDKEIKNFDYVNKVFYGGEDYKIIAFVREDILKLINRRFYTVIGEIVPKVDDTLVKVKFSDRIENFNKEKIEERIFNHFS